MIRDEGRAEFRDAQGSPAGAGDGLIRIEAAMAAEVTAVNRVFARVGDRWEQVADPGAIGWWFEAWRDGRSGVSWVCFSSPRVIDAPLLDGPLAGLLVLAPETGDAVPDPRALGRRFALQPADAKVFSTRVIDAGGSVTRVAGDPVLLDALAGELAPAVARLKALVGSLGEALAAGTGITRAAVRGAEAEVWEAFATCRRLGAEIARQAGVDGARTVDARIDADRIRREAQALREEAEDLIGQYREMARIATAALADAPPPREAVAPGLSDHLAAVCAHLAARGVRAHMDQGSLVIDLDGQVVRIGDGAQIGPG